MNSAQIAQQGSLGPSTAAYRRIEGRRRTFRLGRPATPSAAGRPVALYLRLLGHLQRVVNFDPEVPHGALELGVPK